MDTSTRAALAAGVTAGYVAGRTKKGKVAVGLLSLAAGRALDPLGRGARKIAEGSEFEELRQQIRGGPPESEGGGVLTDLANRGLLSLAGAIEQRTRALEEGTAPTEPEEAEPEDAEPEEAEPEDAEPEDAEPEDAEPEDAEPEEEVTGGAEGDTEEEERDEGGTRGEHEPATPPRRRPRRAKAGAPSSRAAGPKNPPAEKARALARKTRAEKSAHEPGPGNPPAEKARARKRAEKSAREPGPQNPPAAKARETARKAARQKSSGR